MPAGFVMPQKKFFCYIGHSDEWVNDAQLENSCSKPAEKTLEECWCMFCFNALNVNFEQALVHRLPAHHVQSRMKSGST